MRKLVEQPVGRDQAVVSGSHDVTRLSLVSSGKSVADMGWNYIGTILHYFYTSPTGFSILRVFPLDRPVRWLCLSSGEATSRESSTDIY